jgi:hypothetical protein
MKKYTEELHETGSVRLYESEGFNLNELMNSFEIMFDNEEFSYGIIDLDNGKGPFIEVIDIR